MDIFINYLIKNKEWIFSGLGIFVIGGIISLIKILINHHKKATQKSMKQINKDNSSGIQNNYYQGDNEHD